MSSTNPIDAINAMQKRILAGEDPTAEEMQEVIAQLRSERGVASASTTKAKTPSAPLDLASLFGKKE
jgi:hypothetical protein